MSTADYLKSPSDHFPPRPIQRNIGTAFLSPGKGLEVTETSSSVRVETEKPHLVSLGGGRLSTAVTIHPLPEGRTKIGKEGIQRKQDILVDGTGIEAEHCYIENIDGVVTIYPVAPMVAVDGMRVVEPARLSQGSMICLGRSTFFRFNHPQEAKLIKQILPSARISMAPVSFHPVLEDPLLPDHSIPATLDFQSSPQSLPLESSDFVEKVSKFEYLAHSRPAPVTSQETPKWFVREGLRIPSTPPPARVTGRGFRDDEFGRHGYRDEFFQIGSNSYPGRNASTLPTRTKPALTLVTPASPGVRRIKGMDCRSGHGSPVQFWSGRCTPTSPHLGGSPCGNEEHLRACEDELKKQHRKAVQERLKDEEQERQERHRLEEILNMCAEYENQEKLNRDNKHKKSPSGFQNSPRNEKVANFVPKASSTPNQKPINFSPPYSSSSNSLPHHTTHQPNRIKTNGSLPRERTQVLQPNVNHSGEGADSSSPLNNHKTINSASSEDELNEILGLKSQPSSNSSGDVSEHFSNTSPHLGTGSLKYPHSPRTHHRIPPTNQVQAQIEVCDSRFLWPEMKRNKCESAATDRGSPSMNKKSKDQHLTLEALQEKNEELRKLCRLKVGYVRQISALKQAFSNFEAQENEIFRELEMEQALINGELKEEERLLLESQKQLESLHVQENILQEQSEKAREDEQAQLESAKLQLSEREERVTSLKRTIEDNQNDTKDESSPVRLQDAESSYKRELELMEAEKKAFEDLEFQQLESQSHREEDKEALANSIAEHILTMQERKDRRLDLEVQQKQLLQQITAEREMFNSKMKEVSGSLDQVQVKLDSLDHMLREMTRVDPLTSLDSSPDSSPRSSRSEMLVHNPRQHEEAFKIAGQVNGIDISGDWREARDAGCRSFHSLESESSSIMSSDIPGESLYNSSGDRSRPTSYPADGVCANRDLYLSSPDEISGENEVKKREQLLALQDQDSLIDSPKRAPSSEVIRRDKQKTQRPLTRYLPIRSQEFDLRQHVESDGHQIELCPHVSITSSTCSGSLHKLGGKWHAWKKRWFVFDRVRRALLYYTDRKEIKLRGGAYFQAIQEVYVDHLHSVKSPNPQATFCMKTRDRIYYLMAPSPEAMRIWVDVIFTGAEGYLEFLGDQ